MLRYTQKGRCEECFSTTHALDKSNLKTLSVKGQFLLVSLESRSAKTVQEASKREPGKFCRTPSFRVYQATETDTLLQILAIFIGLKGQGNRYTCLFWGPWKTFVSCLTSDFLFLYSLIQFLVLEVPSFCLQVCIVRNNIEAFYFLFYLISKCSTSELLD